jgi:GTP-binding protein
MNFQKVEFLISAASPKDFPKTRLPEIAFAGKSNVGKSSVINRILQRKNFARVGEKPGKTIHVNYFTVDSKCYFVDLPGYGFARTGKANRDQWSGFIAKYLSGSDNLAMVCQLIDIRHKPLENDIECFHWLRSCGLMVQIILTKADKLSKNAAMSQKALFRREFGLTDDQIMVYSSTNHTMRGDLIERIMGAVNNF